VGSSPKRGLIIEEINLSNPNKSHKTSGKIKEGSGVQGEFSITLGETTEECSGSIVGKGTEVHSVGDCMMGGCNMVVGTIPPSFNPYNGVILKWVVSPIGSVNGKSPGDHQEENGHRRKKEGVF